MKKTKIVCTLGPATEDKDQIKKLVLAGMNVARLNFSHGTYDQFTKIIKNIREVSQEMDRPIAVMQDLQGPKIRIGTLPKDGIPVKRGDLITLYDGEAYLENNGKRYIPLQYKALTKDAQKGHTLMIDDGKIEIEIIGRNIQKTKLECEVKNDGILYSNKGVNAPQTSLSVESLNNKDLQDLAFGIELDVDYVALSFVRSAQDIVELKAILKEAGKENIKVISKIERPEAMAEIEAITQESDAIMVARGDLGIEIPASQVPIAQKLIIKLANKYAKPVITATQVLNSMVESPVPTRAEVSDAANAIFDQTDAIMLSNETAVGKYPIKACQVLSDVASATEEEIEKQQVQNNRFENYSLSDAIALNAVELADDIDATCLVALSNRGYTAQQIAEHRPSTKIVVFTPNEKTRNQLSLVWGLNTIFAQKVDFKHSIPSVQAKLEEQKLIKDGDEIVICNSAKGKKERFISTFVL